MSLENRPRRRKGNSLLKSEEYVLDIDKEIMEMEQIPVDGRIGTTSSGDGLNIVRYSNNDNKVAVDPKKRKRGRPRKHPVVVETTPVVKRPRGRPRGSGKHQRAATTPVHDGMAPQTLPQTSEPAISVGDATPECSESTPIATQGNGIMVTPMHVKQEGMGLRSSSGKNRRKGSLPTKTEL